AERDPRIVVRFALFAGVALLIALGVGLLIARTFANSRAQNDVRQDARFLASRLGHDDLARTAFLSARLEGAADPALLDAFLAPAGAMVLALLVLYLALLPIMHRMTIALRVRAESLRASLVERGRLAAIVDGSTDAIVGRDRDGAITTWNTGAERIYGWTAAE